METQCLETDIFVWHRIFIQYSYSKKNLKIFKNNKDCDR